MDSCPTEWLPAFCQYPMCVVAMRLTCWRFYREIPSDTFKKLGPAEWSSDFWTLRAVFAPGFTHFIHHQHRRWTGGKSAPLAPEPAGMKYVAEGERRPNIIWFHNTVPTTMRDVYGIKYMEPPASIFYLAVTCRPGRVKNEDIIRGLGPVSPDWDTIVLFPIKIQLAMRTSDNVRGVFKDMLAFADCETGCKIFRRK